MSKMSPFVNSRRHVSVCIARIFLQSLLNDSGLNLIKLLGAHLGT